ncbi:MAG: hypothetical protein F4186_14015 [Boseongicola sp. SB0676_bin_33]|uniref:Uncharacterized protein n=1 Tax=Boseongicola sp. SB0664_bin_43 TaxID=2604844 RepID=A0A6B0XWK7_9RHOB|nr:hypothetical protein [Boseongicola sp. SB0664_bin_43]MYF90335.1 hypothetical protein [Boseongicola sp. SB0676_bin_33]
MTQTKPKPELRIKPNTYKPTKAELEEMFVLRKPDGSVPTPEEVIQAVLRPVKVVVDPDA